MTVTSWGIIATLASKAGSKYPELTAAQWALESEWGKYPSGKNNFFGLKGDGTKTKTTEVIDGKEVTIDAEFLDFDTPDACVEYLVSRWYKDYTYNGTSYKGVNNAPDRTQAAKMLVTEGYCTDPNYAMKLINLMNKNTAIQSTDEPQPTGPIKLVNAAAYFKNLPHQVKAWEDLQNTLSDEALLKFTIDYRGTNTPSVEFSKNKFPLNVPYFYQRDSKTGHGERSCQSSSLAMVVKFINANLITDDDDYLLTVFRYGDTVSQTAQSKALDSLGLKNRFSQTGTESDLIKILDDGMPVPIGVLHKGNIESPSGGGHWICLIGYDQYNFFVHDPFGEMDLINGGYPKAGPTDGKNKKYSRKNLLKRWLVQSASDGWYWDLRGN